MQPNTEKLAHIILNWKHYPVSSINLLLHRDDGKNLQTQTILLSCKSTLAPVWFIPDWAVTNRTGPISSVWLKIKQNRLPLKVKPKSPVWFDLV